MKDFTHTVEVPWANTSKQVEIYTWCEDHFGTKNLDWGCNGVVAFSTGRHVYYFTNEGDATFFKLKWG
jgi:hypothetical protein